MHAVAPANTLGQRLHRTLTQPVDLLVPAWGLTLYAAVNAAILVTVLPAGPIDWAVLVGTPASYERGDHYAPDEVPYVWSPVIPWLMVLIAPMGYAGWTALHLGAVLTLRNPTLILLTALSVGFWADVGYGNLMTFVFVAGALASQGSRAGAVAFVALSVLIPRPLQLPLLVWLLWRHPWLRIPAVGIVLVHGLLVLASGYGQQWLTAMPTIGSQQSTVDLPWAPTSLFGLWWLAVGIPVGVWLTARGYVGLAGLLVSPYLFAQHLLFVLLDADRLRRIGRRA